MCSQENIRLLLIYIIYQKKLSYKYAQSCVLWIQKQPLPKGKQEGGCKERKRPTGRNCVIFKVNTS